MSYTEDDLRGVGGWLALFVLGMAVFSPLGMIVGNALDLYGDPQVAIAYGEAWGPMQAVIWGSVAIGLAICWFVTYRLVRVERWSTVRLTIAGIWTLCVGLNWAQLLLISFISGVPLGELTALAAVELIRGVIFGVIWTAYFMLSTRVANTYRRDPESEELAERFA